MNSRFRRSSAAPAAPQASTETAPVSEAATMTAHPDSQGDTLAGAADTENLFWARWQVAPPQGHPGDAWEKQDCNQCLPRRNTLLVENGGSRFYCTSCGRHGDATVEPSRYVGGRAPIEDIRWPSAEMDLHAVLARHGFDAEQVKAWFPDLVVQEAPFPMDSDTPGWRPALRFDVRDEDGGPLRDYLFVGLDDEGRLSSSARLPKGKPYPWGWERITGDKVLFVDDPLDALALRLAGQDHAVCLPHTLNPARASGGDWTGITLLENRLSHVHRIELAFANDDAGHRLEDEVSRRMGRDRVFRTRWDHLPTVDGARQGAHQAFLLAGAEGIADALEAISPYPISGIHELRDVEDEYDQLYDTGLLPGLLVGLPSLDDCYSVKLAQITVLHGIPQHGKTTLMDEILINLAKRYDWQFGVFSAENSKLARHYAALTEKLVGKPFSETPGHERVSVAEREKAKSFLNRHVRMIRPDEEKGNWSLDGILELARSLVFRYGIRGLVIDPWNELEHTRPMHLGRDEYLAQQLSKVRRFAEVNGVHVWIVAHPRTMAKDHDGEYPVPTPYMLEGGGMWNNKADFILAVWRRRGLLDDAILDIHIQKCRWKEDGHIGLVSLLYHPLTNRFTDQVNQARRREALGNPKANISLQDQLLPRPLPPTPLPNDIPRPYFEISAATAFA